MTAIIDNSQLSMSTKCPSKACICSALTVWLFVAVCVLIVSSVVYLSPFLKVVRYKKTTCRIENSFFTTQYICPCPAGGQHCPAYPCFLVHVSLNYSDGKQWTVNLYINDVQQATVLDASSDQQERCTLRSCDGDHFYNRKIVDNFQRDYGVREKIVECYHDPWNIRSGAILFAELPGWQVFHTVFWPGLAVALGLTVCGLFCHRCRRQAAVAAGSSLSADDLGELGNELKGTDEEKERGGLDNHGSPAVSEIDSSVIAARAILARKKRNKKSLRNLWMVPRDV